MYLPFDALSTEAARVLGVSADLSEHTVQSLILSGALIEDRTDGERAVYLPNLYKMECETANLLMRLRDSFVSPRFTPEEAQARIAQFEAEQGVELCQRQRDAQL